MPPAMPVVYYSFGEFVFLFKSMGDVENAIDACDRAIQSSQLTSNDSYYYYDYATLLRENGQRGRARQIIQLGISRFPDKKDYFERFFEEK